MDLPGSPSQSPTIPKRTAPNPADKPSAEGRNRLGRYLVTGRLGQGGMGVVYEAEDTLLKRQVAIKLLPRAVSSNPEALKRFLREGQAAAKLNHAHVVAVYDIGETGGTYYIVMELIKGGSAQDYLRSHGPFHWTEATSILMDVCRGVVAAHQAGLIHRDIKPANILRSTEGVVKLGDFGLVKPAGRKGTVVTALGGVVGTPHYMSPEQSQSASVDERSDIYALGATYYALLTGRPPYQAADSVQVLFAHCSHPIPDPREAIADIPPQCSAIIRRAMAKNRAQRHARASELLAELEQVLKIRIETTPATATRVPPSNGWGMASSSDNTNAFSLADEYPGERTEANFVPKKRRWKTVGLGLLAFLAVALLVKVLFLGKKEPTSNPRPELSPTAKDDWPDQAAAAEKAIRNRNATAMRSVRDSIKVTQKRTQDREPGQHEAMRLTLNRLEKALIFRESITKKGLVLSMEGLLTSVAFSPDDHWLAASQGNGDAGAFVWDSHTGEKRYTLWPRRTVMTSVQSLAFSHDSKVLAAACADSKGIRLSHFTEGKDSTLPLGPGVTRALTVVFSPSSRKLVAGLEAVGSGKGRPYLKIWDIDTGLEPFPFKAEHSDKVWSVAYSTGGEQIASGSQDKRVVMWNAETGRIWRELRTGITIQAIACGPQGRSLAVAGQDQETSMLQFWDYAGERLLASKPSPHGACRCVAYSRNGALLASGSGSRVFLWNAETHELLATLSGHSLDVTSLAFSAEGGILATGSNDQTLRLWDIARFLTSGPLP